MRDWLLVCSSQTFINILSTASPTLKMRIMINSSMSVGMSMMVLSLQ
jgi:hypothetical protein